MIPLHKACCYSLKQVLFVIQRVEEQGASKNENLYQSSKIGRHVRHILDHYLALKNGLERNQVDYNQRNRDGKVEQDSEFASEIIIHLIKWISSLDGDNQELIIESEIDCEKEISETFQTNLNRELMYLINHTTHHTAYIKLVSEKYGIELPEDVGLAPCTAPYLRNEAISGSVKL